jgi:hypothetical protein
MAEIETVLPAKNIYEAINRVMCRVGYVQKESSPNLKYKFASESALIAALRPCMVEEGIVMLPVGYDNVVVEYYTTGDRGTRMTNTTVTGHFRFIHAPSGTSVDVFTRGEGADSGDKSNNKAMTDAFKYCLRQSFIIETGEDPDSDDGRISTSTSGGTVVSGGVAVQQSSKWTGEQFGTLFSEHIFENEFEAKSVLNRAKKISPATPLKGLVFWGKHYRGTRDGDPKLTVDECIAQADYDFEQEVARLKAEEPK